MGTVCNQIVKFTLSEGPAAAGRELGATVEINVGSALLQKPFVETLSLGTQLNPERSH